MHGFVGREERIVRGPAEVRILKQQAAALHEPEAHSFAQIVEIHSTWR